MPVHLDGSLERVAVIGDRPRHRGRQHDVSDRHLAVVVGGVPHQLQPNTRVIGATEPAWVGATVDENTGGLGQLTAEIDPSMDALVCLAGSECRDQFCHGRRVGQG